MEECDLEVPGCGRNIDQQKARMAAVTEDEATPGHMGELMRERGGAARRKPGAMAAPRGESESWLSSSPGRGPPSLVHAILSIELSEILILKEH